MTRLLSLLLVLSIEIATFAQDKYAVVVGVETYDTDQFTNLDYATEDAKGVAEALTSLGFDTTVMSDDSHSSKLKPSSAQKIADTIVAVSHSCQKGDTLVVSLSGHGIQFSDEPLLVSGVRETYFCPGDASQDAKPSLLKISQVVSFLNRSKATRKLLLIDACRNEVLSNNGKRKSSVRRIDLGAIHENARSVPGGLAVLFSCSSKQFSWEHEPLRHSVFSHHVIEFLNGEADSRYYDVGQIGIQDLASYVSKKTNDYVRANRLSSNGQYPVMRGETANWPLGKRLAKATVKSTKVATAEKQAKETNTKNPVPKTQGRFSSLMSSRLEKQLSEMDARRKTVDEELSRLPPAPPMPPLPEPSSLSERLFRSERNAPEVLVARVFIRNLAGGKYIRFGFQGSLRVIDAPPTILAWAINLAQAEIQYAQWRQANTDQTVRFDRRAGESDESYVKRYESFVAYGVETTKAMKNPGEHWRREISAYGEILRALTDFQRQQGRMELTDHSAYLHLAEVAFVRGQHDVSDVARGTREKAKTLQEIAPNLRFALAGATLVVVGSISKEDRATLADYVRAQIERAKKASKAPVGSRAHQIDQIQAAYETSEWRAVMLALER